MSQDRQHYEVWGDQTVRVPTATDIQALAELIKAFAHHDSPVPPELWIAVGKVVSRYCALFSEESV